MPAAEDRQARALENISREMVKFVKILEAVNTNLVVLVKRLTEEGSDVLDG